MFESSWKTKGVVLIVNFDNSSFPPPCTSNVTGEVTEIVMLESGLIVSSGGSGGICSMQEEKIATIITKIVFFIFQ